MRYSIVINRDSGTMRATDLKLFIKHLEQTFGSTEHEIEIHNVTGKEIANSLDSEFANNDNDAVIVAGGDGTISSAAENAWKSGKALGVIPAGTMNLFARSLQIPLEVEAAATALAGADIHKCDIATANGKPFLHEFSAGFHPRLVRMRDRYDYETRLGKIKANVLSLLDTFARPPSFPVEITIDGETQSRKVSCVAISNNLFGEGHLPYADRLDHGKLGIYITDPVDRRRGIQIMIDVFLGSWRSNPDIEEHTATEIVLHFPKRRRNEKAVRDGELIKLEEDVTLRIHPKALRVLVPVVGSK